MGGDDHVTGNITDYLASQAHGEFISEGEFRLSPEELARKLGDSMFQPQNWVLKFVQAATVLRAKTVQIKMERQWLRIEFTLDDHFPVDSAEDFLNQSPSDRAHKHLLYGLFCSVNLYTSEEVRFLWTGANSQLHRILAKERAFELSAQTLDSGTAPALAPALAFALKRKPTTTVEKLFRKASFEAELRVLQERVGLYPGNMFLDGRSLDNWSRQPNDPYTREVCLVSRPSTSPPYLNLRWKRLPNLEDFPRPHGPYKRDLLLEIVYSDPARTRHPCTVAWFVDGIILQEEIILAADTNVGMRLYLSAEGLKTDLSTFGLVENDEKSQRLRCPSVREWLLNTLTWAEGASLKRAEAFRQDSFQDVLLGRARAPVDRLLLVDGLRKRRNEWMQYLHRT